MIVFQSIVIKVNKKTLTRYVGVFRIFDWGERPNRKSHVMTSSIFFKKRDFLQNKDTVEWRFKKPGPGLACNLGFAKEKGLELKVKRFPKLSNLGDVVRKLV